MLQPSDIQALVQQALADAKVQAQLDGNKCQLSVVSESFIGLRTVKRQQLVYASLNHLIQSGELHAVSMQTLTPEEFQQL